MKFRAAILREIGRPLEIADVEVGELGPDDVLVRLGASGLCHSDLEVISGALKRPLPAILGHEGAGTVERVGASVTRLKAGDHVVCSWNPNCGHCFYCDRDVPILCEPFTRFQPAGLSMDGKTKFTLQGQSVYQFSAVSSHAEFCVVPQAGAVRIPNDIPFDRACLIGCGVMTGVGAVLRLAKMEPGSSVAVIGTGAVGLNAVQGAALGQAAVVVALDVDDRKLAMAQAFGATHAVKAGAGAQEVESRVRTATGGRGADYVFECAGSEASLQLALDVCRPGGQVVILGKTSADLKVGLRFGSLMGEKRIIRSSYGGARPHRDFPWLAQLYLDGKLKLDELISERIDLTDINRGFEAMARGEVVRTVITFGA